MGLLGQVKEGKAEGGEESESEGAREREENRMGGGERN